MDWLSINREAQEALVKAKDKIPSFPSKQAWMKRVSKNGSVCVMEVNIYTLEFRAVKKKDVEYYGVDPDSLTDFYEFKERLKVASEFAKKAQETSRAQFERCVDGYKNDRLFPLYAKRRNAYDSYLESPEWSAKRQECISFHGSTCMDCKECEATDIHHRHYETLGGEDPENDIVPLCRECHERRHSLGSLMDKPTEATHFMVGSFVEHEIFGVGNVAGYKKDGTSITVDFIDNGEKDLVLQLAKLKAFRL